MEGLLYFLLLVSSHKRHDLEKARMRLSCFGFVWVLQIVLYLCSVPQVAFFVPLLWLLLDAFFSRATNIKSRKAEGCILGGILSEAVPCSSLQGAGKVSSDQKLLSPMCMPRTGQSSLAGRKQPGKML